MLLEKLAGKYQLNAEVTAFMQQYGYAGAVAKQVWPLPELADEILLKRCEELNLLEARSEIQAALERAADDLELKTLFCYLHFYWFELDNAPIYGYKLPDLKICAPQDGDILNLALAISGCGAVEKKFAELGLAKSYAAAALQRIREDAQLYTRRIGHWGYPESGHHWMRFFAEGKLFRIGRLEYMIEPEIMKFLPRIFRHKSSGNIIALCRSNWQLDAEGFQLWRDIKEEPYCIAQLEEDEQFIRGIPIDPNGRAETDKIAVLDKEEYEALWLDGDLVPDVHIPPGGNMRPELCQESLAAAQKFFAELTGRTVKGFSSFSWIFNPDFCEVLPEANLTKFMQQLYLMPFSGSSLSGLSFVFGKEDQNWSDYPAENSLQRAFHQLRKLGRRLKTGGMFIEAEGIKEFGSQYYRRSYHELMQSCALHIEQK